MSMQPFDGEGSNNFILMPEPLKLVFLETVFLGKEPPKFWIGLTTSSFVEVQPTMRTLMESEPIAAGYRRQPANDWSISLNPVRVSTTDPKFRNSAVELEDRWPEVRGWFIATEETGADGLVVASGRLQFARTLLPRDTLVVPLAFSFSG